MTRDEVYIDIEVSDNADFAARNYIQYNKAMYTATSRATKFAYVSRFNPTEHTIDNEGIRDRAATQAKLNESRYDADIKAKQEQLKILQEFKKESKPATSTADSKKESEKNVEDVVEDTKEGEVTPTPKEGDTPKEDETQEAPTTVYDEADTEPSNEYDDLISSLMNEDYNNDVYIPELEEEYKPIAIATDLTNFVNIPNPQSDTIASGGGINIGDTVFFVKDVSNGKTRYVAIKQEGDVNILAAIIEEGSERNISKELFQNPSKLESLEPVELSITGSTVYIKSGQISVNSTAAAFVHQNTTPLRYEYDDGNPTAILSSDTEDLKNFLSNTLRQMWYGQPEKYISNYTEVLENPLDYLDVKSFKTPNHLQKSFKGSPVPTLTEDMYGIPFIVINGLKSKNGNPIKPILIKVTTPILNTNTPLVTIKSENESEKDIITADVLVKEFIPAVTRFHKELEKASLPGAWSTVRMGEPVTIDKHDYYPFHWLINWLSDAKEGKSTTMSIPLKSAEGLRIAERLKELLPDVEVSSMPDSLIKAAKKVDELLHGERKAGERRASNGRAQLAMNALSKSNLFITTPSGKVFILRDTKQEGKEVKDQRIVGRQLAGPAKIIHTDEKKGIKALPFIPNIKEKLINNFKKYVERKEAEGKTDSVYYNLAKQLLQLDEAKIAQHKPFTIEDLREIFLVGKDSKGKYNKISAGFGLRAPVQESSDLVDKLDAGTVGTTLKRIVPTQLVLTTSKVEQVAPKDEIRIVTPYQWILENAYKDGKVKSKELILEELFKQYSETQLEEFRVFTGQKTVKQAVTYVVSNLSDITDLVKVQESTQKEFKA